MGKKKRSQTVDPGKTREQREAEERVITVPAPKRREPGLVQLQRRKGGAHSTKRGRKGYKRHPKHKGRSTSTD